jgi:hypothetical protein
MLTECESYRVMSGTDAWSKFKSTQCTTQEGLDLVSVGFAVSLNTIPG